uniref:Uncharacterized protein n=1 Tax=Physcomitrium patens TaxID=3218 RepID=A0A2K1J3X0_PHYPA|nr:hypothetical protein PHYPA_022051 [Physcomitrium patens]
MVGGPSDLYPQYFCYLFFSSSCRVILLRYFDVMIPIHDLVLDHLDVFLSVGFARRFASIRCSCFGS